MPPTNLAIKVNADKDLGGPGCLFTGPTTITFNCAGTMTVTSPGTSPRRPITTTAPAGGRLSGDPGDPGQRSDLCPDHADEPSDPNFTPSCTPGTQIAVEPRPRYRNQPLGYPQYTDMTTYGCTDGDVFLTGTLNGRSPSRPTTTSRSSATRHLRHRHGPVTICWAGREQLCGDLPPRGPVRDRTGELLRRGVPGVGFFVVLRSEELRELLERHDPRSAVRSWMPRSWPSTTRSGCRTTTLARMTISAISRCSARSRRSTEGRSH